MQRASAIACLETRQQLVQLMRALDLSAACDAVGVQPGAIAPELLKDRPMLVVTIHQTIDLAALQQTRRRHWRALHLDAESRAEDIDDVDTQPSSLGVQVARVVLCVAATHL